MAKVKVCSKNAAHVNTDQSANGCAECGAPLVEQVIPEGGQAVEFVFVVDGTGSMAHEITYVKENLEYLADLLKTKGMNPKLGMVVFRDFDVDGATALEVFPLDQNPETFAGRVKGIDAHGGGDPDEHGLDGLQEACKLFSGGEAKRCVMFITDTGTKPARDGKGIREVAGTLRQYRVVLQAVVASKEYWKDLGLNPRTFFYELGDRSKKAMDDTMSRIVGTILAA